MESVETLCDNFTLINRSHNILSGNVAEIRRQMGRNHYRLSFQGEPQTLLDTLGDRIESYTMSKPELNDAVEIVTFDRALPSMNDIFIKTVEGYNAAHNISTTPDE